MNLQQIGRKIANLRKQRDMTQNELADLAGVSYQAVSSWERGLTMPDVSKLPGISQVLGVSIDELLDNAKEVDLVKNVLNQNTSVYVEEELYIDEIAEIAPMLRPSQVSELVVHVNTENTGLGQLASIAPFVSQDVLQEMADKLENTDNIGDLCGLAPFLDKEYMDSLALKIEKVSGIGALTGLAPFVSQHVLGELALKVEDVSGAGVLTGIAPFLSREVIDTLAQKIANVPGTGVLVGLAPFVSKHIIDELALKIVEVSGYGALAGISPFVSKNVMDELARKITRSN